MLIYFTSFDSMSLYTLQNIVNNYQLLAHSDQNVREAANIYLMQLIYQDDAWKITEEMITKCVDQAYQLLGAQILYQKLQKEISNLQKGDIRSLKEFLFGRLASPALNIATIRKLSSSAALVAVISCLEDWPELITDVVSFMKLSASHLQNGLILLSNLAEELSKSNCIRQGIKIQVKEKIFEQEALLSDIFLSAMTINPTLTNFALEAVENWVAIGFPLMKYKGIINVLVMLIGRQEDLFFESCCKVLADCMKSIAQVKFQTLSAIDLSTEVQKYSADEIESLKLIISYIRSTKTQLFAVIKTAQGFEKIEQYTLIVKEMLLSFGFLLLEDVGFELIQIIVTTLESKNLKLSFSTFQFWLDFCEKWSKTKTEPVLQQKIWKVVDYLFSILLDKIKLQSNATLFQLIKEDDTVDDLEDVSFAEYRKEAQYIIRHVYEFFTKKKQGEGSNVFFAKLIAKIQGDSNYLGVGTELAIYAVKSSIESMVKEYDTQNLINFLQYLISKSQAYPSIPARITAEILGLIKDCNRQIKDRHNLFVSCLEFALKFVQDEQLCHYSVYAFQSLMECIENTTEYFLINNLLSFYQTRTFKKQTVLEKVLDGILTFITKISDKNVIMEYFARIMNAILARNNDLLQRNFEPDAYLLPLIEIKTVLDCFEHFNPNDKEFFRTVFLNISNQGISIVTRIITNYLEKRLPFNNVNELGLSLAVCKSSLKLCENIQLQFIPVSSYITLMNIILSILNPSDLGDFLSYSSLIDIISKVLNQFMNANIQLINNWLGAHLPSINTFFLSYAKQKQSIKDIDPDVIKEFFTIQEGVIIYSQDIFLSQPQTEQILNLALMGLQYLNEKQLQRKVVYFLYLCVQIRPVFACKYDLILKSVLFSVPNVNNLCYINLARILMVIFEGVDMKNKENVIRTLLEYEPYSDVDRDLKEIMAKFMAFSIESKVERYIKGVLTDLTDIKWKKAGSELALHLEMRFSTWKRQFARSLKSGQAVK